MTFTFEDLSLKRIGIAVLAVIVLLLAVSQLWAWYNPLPPRVETVFKTVKVPEYITRIERVEVPVEKIVVIEKELVVKKLDLGPEIVNDMTKQIMSVVEVDPHEGKTTVAAVIDTETGETSMVSRRERRALFAFKSDKEFGIRGGASTDGYAGEMYGRLSFLRIGNTHLALYAEAFAPISGDMSAAAMLEVSYRW